MDKSYALVLLISFPAAVGVLLAAWPGVKDEVVRRASLASSLLVLAAAAFLYIDGGSYNFDRLWVRLGDNFGIHFKVGADGISLLMILLTTLLMPISILCSWTGIQKNVKAFFVSLLILEAGMIGVFCALDLFLFYVFWEITLLPMYLLVGIWGGPKRLYASIKFVLYTVFGSLLMLAAVLYCSWEAKTFDVVALTQKLPVLFSINVEILLFTAFALAFAIKVPLFPLHTWLPDAHTEAPTAGSVILAGVLLKMGGYGFLRFAIPFFPGAVQECATVMVTLSVIGIVYGALMAMAQSDIKRLIAYSSVSHMGFVMLGLFTLNATAAQGSVIQMANHGISTGALFLLIGFLYEKTHKRSINDFGGLAKAMPVYATIFLIVTLSSIGLPGTNGFVGEFLILLGSFPFSPIAVAFAGLGIILGAVYMLRLYRLVFFGKLNRGEYQEIADVGNREMAYLFPLVVLIFVLGVMPNLVLKRTEAPVQNVYRIYESDRN